MGGASSTQLASGSCTSRKRTRRRDNRNPSGRTFHTHTCRTNLDRLIAAKSDNTAGSSFRQLRYSTAVEAYLARTFTGCPEAAVLEQSVDHLLSCLACMSELCTLTSAKSDALFKLLLITVRARSRTATATSVPYAATFGKVLERATGTCLPCIYGGTCGLVDLPCVNLGLCDCVLRPVYCAIFYGNLDLLKLLLRFGAEVWSRDECFCYGRHETQHPLVMVYESLTATAWTRAFEYKKDTPDFIRCHQLAALIVPAEVNELRESCLGFLRLISPTAEYDIVVRMRRSLQHMCRLTLRLELSKRRQLPHGVGLLPLPLSLQRYLLYEDFDNAL
ncbi:hypothetical protein HPB47_024600 [Ixodes persulcatus]|uniref:Uncharacterized protein n=1 Tax=Ixodes persulcatus TaxID=34615 RepID=A0AC60Q518_IXOPE|nr:hypothetical protein HPB47_024600 [Ixodes persulcatus]